MASADLASLKASCAVRDAADGDAGNGVALAYRFCDDGVPPVGGRQPNVGAVRAVTVPQRYDGHAGLPPKTTPDPNAGADPAGNIALDVDVSLPDPARHPPPAGGYPLVVMMHGCCSGSKTSNEAATVDARGEAWHYNNAWFASRGYVVLTYTARGFVNAQGQGSTGETQLDSRRYEVNDLQHLAGQLADDPFFAVDPRRVVVTGGSYGGGLSWMTLTDPTWSSPAGTPMRLVAAGPKYGWTDLVYSLVPNGAHMRDALPTSDPAAAARPLGFPKQSIVAALFLSGTSGVPPPGPRATFPESVRQAFLCLQSSDPFEANPLCAGTLGDVLPSFLNDRSAYYQNDFFTRLASDPAARVPLFSAGALTDPLFTTVEHRRMIERLKATVPGYPVQEYYGDYNHFVQNKPKEWGDLCGADRHVCRIADYPDGDPGAVPASRVAVGVTTRLNRLLDHHARPQGNADEPAPRSDVTASLQICPENASERFPADEPGRRFRAAGFDELAPATLRIEASGTQVTVNDAQPNPHALRSDPVLNTAANGSRCTVETSPGGAPTAGPGVATYDSAPLDRDHTMIGRTRVTVPHTGAGSGIQLNGRLYDLFPDGRQVLVDRGLRRVEAANGTTTFDLNGNGWRFASGHRVRIELAQDNEPYIKHSNQPSSLVLAGVTLELPVRGASAEVDGAPAQAGRRRIRLAVSPRRTRVDRVTRFRFRATTRSGGRRVAVRRATIRFRGRRARTSRDGRAVIRVRLPRPGRYVARASRPGMRAGRAAVRGTRGRSPRFTG